jgi:methionyl-tRNA formyltransferase
LKVAFFGTSEFGADALDRLLASPGIDVAWVVSQPDRPAGRGRSPQPPPVAVRARELGIELIQTDDASATPPAADAGAVVAFGQLVRDPLLHAFPLFNIHPSLLPRWRGAAPVERAIMAGDETTGVCVIELAEQLDAGPIHGVASIPIGATDDAATIRRRALELGVPLLAAALRGETTATPQAAVGVTYAHKLTAGDRRLDWTRSATEIDCTVRSLAPDIGARTELDGRPVLVWSGRPHTGSPGLPGHVEPPLRVGCGAGEYEILELQPAGKRRMGAADYLRGLRVPPAQAQ